MLFELRYRLSVREHGVLVCQPLAHVVPIRVPRALGVTFSVNLGTGNCERGAPYKIVSNVFLGGKLVVEQLELLAVDICGKLHRVNTETLRKFVCISHRGSSIRNGTKFVRIGKIP